MICHCQSPNKAYNAQDNQRKIYDQLYLVKFFSCHSTYGYRQALPGIVTLPHQTSNDITNAKTVHPAI